MIILVFLVHALLALTFPIGRVAVQISGPAFFTGMRMLVAGLILLAYQWYRDGISAHIFRALKLIIVFAVTAIYLTNVLEFWALRYLPAAKTAFLYSLSPFAAALFSYFFFNEKMTLTKLLGMGIGFLGFAYMIFYHTSGEISYGGIGVLSLPEMGVMLAAIASALGWIIMRKKIIRQRCKPIEVLMFGMLIGSVFCFLTSFATENWNPIPIVDISKNGMTVLAYLVAMVIFCNLIGYLLYVSLLKKYTVTFLSFAVFIEPLCSAVYGWVFLKEPITRHFIVSAMLVFIGLYIFYMQELKQGYVIQAVKEE